MNWFDRVNSMFSRKEKAKEDKIEGLIEEVMSLNPPEKVENREITAGSTIHVEQVERGRLSFDSWAKSISGFHDDGCRISVYQAEQAVIQGFKLNTEFGYLENMVKLLVNLAGYPESSCCRFYREVVKKDGILFIQIRLFVWHDLKTPPPKILRDGVAIKLTSRGKTYDYVCKGESYHPSEGKEV